MFQCQLHVSQLEMTTIVVRATGIVAGFAAAVWGWLMSKVVGYPLPFLELFDTMPACATFAAGVLWSLRTRDNRWSVHRSLKPYICVLNCQIFLTLIYPLFNHVVTTLSPTGQTWFVLILPAIKLSCSLWIEESLNDTAEPTPETVVLNVEVFHALFTANCMRTSTTKRTIILLICVDFFMRVYCCGTSAPSCVICSRTLTNCRLEPREPRGMAQSRMSSSCALKPWTMSRGNPSLRD